MRALLFMGRALSAALPDVELGPVHLEPGILRLIQLRPALIPRTGLLVQPLDWVIPFRHTELIIALDVKQSRAFPSLFLHSRLKSCSSEPPWGHTIRVTESLARPLFHPTWVTCRVLSGGLPDRDMVELHCCSPSAA
jgi:hypothetical protein